MIRIKNGLKQRQHKTTAQGSVTLQKDEKDDSPLVFSCGNPLLDIQLHTNQLFWDQYSLKPGGFCFNEGRNDIYTEMQKHPDVHYVAGGAALNSLRVCQGLYKKKSVVFFTGCLADDEYGKRIEELCKEENISTSFMISTSNPTGVCGVSIVDHERSLCTRLGAANDFTVAGLREPVVEKAICHSRIAYITGFFIPVCFDGILEIAQKHACHPNKLFVTSLSANFIVESCIKELITLFPYVDVLCSNSSEFFHLAKVHPDLKHKEFKNAEEIALAVASFPKVYANKPRIIIITNGLFETIVASHWHYEQMYKITKYPVTPVSKTQLVDTNAAGDAFVGGFIYGIIKAMEIEEAIQHTQLNLSTIISDHLDSCIHFAHLAGGHVVKHSGCTFSFDED